MTAPGTIAARNRRGSETEGRSTEELTPYEEAPGASSSSAWLCAACLRAFTVRLIATGVSQ